MKTIYENNKKGPRMRKGEFSKTVVTKELHKKFVENFPEYKNMKWAEFFKRWMDIAQAVRDQAIHNPLGVKLGSYLGELKLQYLPYKKRNIDFSRSQEYGGEVPLINITTRGKIAKIKWERRWAVKFNRILQFYGFSETRELGKMAKVHVDENPEKIRVSRVTTGGKSVWIKKDNK